MSRCISSSRHGVRAAALITAGRTQRTGDTAFRRCRADFPGQVKR